MNTESIRTEALYAHGMQFRDSIYIGIGTGEVTLTDTAVFGDRGISIGSGARALSTDSIAIGTNAEVLNGAARAIIVGSNTTVSTLPKLVGTRVNTGADGEMTDIEAAEDFATNGTYVLYFTSSGAGAAYELYYPMTFVQSATVADPTLVLTAENILITSHFQVGTYRVTITIDITGLTFTLRDPSSVTVETNKTGVFGEDELKFIVSIGDVNKITSGDYIEIVVPTPVVVGTGTAGGGEIVSDHFSFSITDGATPFAEHDLMYIFFSDEFTAQAILIGATNDLNSDSASSITLGSDNVLSTFNAQTIVMGNDNSVFHACLDSIVTGNNNNILPLTSSSIVIGNNMTINEYLAGTTDSLPLTSAVVVGNYCSSASESVCIGLRASTVARGITIGVDATCAYDASLSMGTSAAARGSRDISIGFQAGPRDAVSDFSSSQNNIAIGTSVFTSAQAGSYENVCVGAGSGDSLTTGFANTFLGSFSGSLVEDGSENIAIGRNMWIAKTDAVGSVSIGTANYVISDYSINIGYLTGNNFRDSTNFRGDGNIAIGTSCFKQQDPVPVPSEASCAHNITIGTMAGNDITTGAENIQIGKEASAVSSASNAIALGTLASVTGTNGVAVGKASVATAGEFQLNLSGAAAAPGTGVLTTKLLSSATPGTGPTAGAADAIPGAPSSWLALTLGTTNYLIPMWAGAL